MSNDPFARVDGQGPRKRPSDSDQWEIIVPVPSGSKPAPKQHPKLGKPTAVWTYPDAEGRLLGYVQRFDGPEGKEFRPLTLWRSKIDGALTWKWTSWGTPRPLYGLQRLAERPSAPVVVTGRRKGRRCRCAPPAGLRGGDKSERRQERRKGGLVALAWPGGDDLA
jgi:putative DNA primase/helicase